MKYLSNMDFNKNEIQNAVIQNLAAAPANPFEGQFYYNTSSHKFYVYENTEWVSYATLAELANAIKDKADKATTLSGYGITDAYTKTEVDTKIDEKDSLPEQAGHAGEWLGTNGTDAAWNKLPDASNTAKGVVRIATDAEIVTGTSESEVVNVKQLVTGLAGKVDNADLPTKVSDLENDSKFVNESTLTTELAKKQDTLTFDEDPTEDSENVVKSGGVFSALADKADKATTIAGYGITDAYTKSEVDAKVGSVYKVKGSVNAFDDLPTSNQTVGDVYNIIETGANYVWTEDGWDKLSETIDLTPYLTKTEAGNTYETKDNVAQIKEDLETAISDAKDEAIEAAEGASHKLVVVNEALNSTGGVASWTIAHTFGEDVSVQIKEVATGAVVIANVIQSNNSVTIKMNSTSGIEAGVYKVVIVG